MALGEPATDAFTLDVDTTIAGQGITAIVGPSGSGKTTLLRCIAGLLHAQQGDCSVAGECWQRAGLFLATHKRPLGYVFQEASLLAHLTAQGNLDYAMKRAHRALPEGFADQVIEIMGIGALLSRMPHQLSGGERQRVAIARALLVAPSLLLMDEPLASLDTARKQEILPYLERLHETVQTPVLYVSHSMDEVARIADDVVVLDAGRIHTQGKLETVFSQLNLPLNKADETATIHTGRIVERDTQWHLSRLELADGQNIWTKDDGDKLGQDVRLRILARDVSLSLNDVSDTSILNRLRVQVTQIAADHDEAMALVQLTIGAVTSNEILIARITQRSVAHLDLKVGQVLWAQIKSVAVVR
ncbi:MAG: molybdenum ABC transporter ATP-binding protein [Pseudomonadaceae bacterium]|nr:molybdenum ABC transporter ATP-binding protein [Pseudomonadaceae bacterium]